MTRWTEIAAGLGLLGAIITASISIGRFVGEAEGVKVALQETQKDIRELRQKPLCPCHE